MSDFRASTALDVDDDPLDFLATVSDRIDGFLYRALNDRDYTMLRVSSGFERMLGLSSREWVVRGLSFTDLIHPDDRAHVAKVVDRAIETHARWKLNYRLRAANGEYVPVFETGGTSIDPATGEVNLYGVIVDMRTA